MSENRYYVYAYLDPRKNGEYKYGDFYFEYEPFYIGKGCRWRLTQHISQAKNNKRHKSPRTQKINKLLSIGLMPIIIRVKEQLTNDDAYELEYKLIKLIGRIDLGTGCLTNCSEGGKQSEINGKELRERINGGRKKIPNLKGEKNPMYGVRRYGKDSPHYGRKHTKETKIIISKTHKGKQPNSKSFKNGHTTWNKGLKGVQSAWNKGISGVGKEYKFLKDGNIVIIQNLFQYCKENMLSYSAMNRLNSFGYAHSKKKPNYTNKNYYKGYINPNF